MRLLLTPYFNLFLPMFVDVIGVFKSFSHFTVLHCLPMNVQILSLEDFDFTLCLLKMTILLRLD